MLLFVLGGYFIFRDLKVLFRIKKKSFLLRKIKKVRVYTNDTICVPFSFWLPGQANVIIPSALVDKPKDFKIAIAHELQHHRQRDTRWIYLLSGLKLFCFINPASYLWNKWISEIQEYACDEILVDHNRINAQDYARCLVEVAQSAINQRFVPVSATGLSFLVEGHLLKRRIKRMLSEKRIYLNKRVSILVGVLLTVFLGIGAFASKGLIQDRRVTMIQAKSMLSRAQQGTEFQVVVNDLVLVQLNRYIGTPAGRDFMKKSLQRMQNYRNLVEKYLHKYAVPEEFLAMPIIESGYQNLAPSQNPEYPSWRAVGLWQFIASTARNYGLKVDSEVDERLNVEILTDAAMRYLKSNQMRFKDWSLAASAYNMGEENLQKAINEVGSKDAWVLIRRGHEGDKNYLAKLMAAIIIMKNPQSLE
ncbi:MAG: M56 and MltD domain-containing protein [Bdellovibrionota bacterium]